MENYHNIGTSTDWIIMVAYFAIVMLFGSYFARYNRNTQDFFFGGRRFSWWLIAMSIVATGVGSHSFIKYSAKAFEHGFSSSMTYMNDWFFLPLFLFGWLPIIVYTKIRSIPEYFEKRFSPLTRSIATLFLLIYMIGYIAIGFLTLGIAALPLLPESFTFLGMNIEVTLMGVVIVIAIITGFYITFGGQTAVIFTDLLQGFILIFAGILLFFLGVDYIGGWGLFWNYLPAEWKLPLAHFNRPSSFNFVGIFWQDGIAGSIGFLFMNMGLVMRFMATKSVDEGRKAAVFNVLFMLPVSAVVVANAGWIGKVVSLTNPEVVSPNTDPDQIFVVVANLVSQPGVFGFIMAALTAALMSTVDTLINATAAIYINDIHRPVKKFLKSKIRSAKEEDKEELFSAQISSVVITALGVTGVLLFKDFPTVYEAHGFFHSTLTPPLVTAIFLGVFWKKFTPAAVITTFIAGVALMILGGNYPGIFISPFDHGTPMDPRHPYTYIRALYNLIVCTGVGLISAWTYKHQFNYSEKLKKNGGAKNLMALYIVVGSAMFVMMMLNIGNPYMLLFFGICLIPLISIPATYFTKYDAVAQTDGLTAWSVQRAMELFKGGKVNDAEGEVIKVNWKIKSGEDNTINFSVEDMSRMKANEGDLVYISDARKYMGGLKSIHSVYGKPHSDVGIVYINEEQKLSGQFVEGKILSAEKEM